MYTNITVRQDVKKNVIRNVKLSITTLYIILLILHNMPV